MKQLQACLEMQAAVLAEFTQVLDLEALAMGEGRFADLPPLIERKSELARQLADLDRERALLQRRAGLGDRPTGTIDVDQAWAQLRELAGQAREANHRNGLMVHTLLDFTRQALASLKGAGRPTYGSDGRYPSGAAARGKSLAQG